MAVETLCQVCENRPGRHDCDRCGTVVCRLHYDAEMRFCADCASKAKPDGRRGDTFRY